mmetsp:Transcript_26226/g.48042  ORF Transcript_26226/g.48042 Transcript_26226/m.48042 type:complete len:125 (-) Transcript_26226:387-761(-)
MIAVTSTIQVSASSSPQLALSKTIQLLNCHVHLASRHAKRKRGGRIGCRRKVMTLKYSFIASISSSSSSSSPFYILPTIMAISPRNIAAFKDSSTIAAPDAGIHASCTCIEDAARHALIHPSSP